VVVAMGCVARLWPWMMGEVSNSMSTCQGGQARYLIFVANPARKEYDLSVFK
jgi:hypothetical protein